MSALSNIRDLEKGLGISFNLSLTTGQDIPELNLIRLEIDKLLAKYGRKTAKELCYAPFRKDVEQAFQQFGPSFWPDGNTEADRANRLKYLAVPDPRGCYSRSRCYFNDRDRKYLLNQFKDLVVAKCRLYMNSATEPADSNDSSSEQSSLNEEEVPITTGEAQREDWVGRFRNGEIAAVSPSEEGNEVEIARLNFANEMESSSHLNVNTSKNADLTEPVNVQPLAGPRKGTRGPPRKRTLVDEHSPDLEVSGIGLVSDTHQKDIGAVHHTTSHAESVFSLTPSPEFLMAPNVVMENEISMAESRRQSASEAVLSTSPVDSLIQSPHDDVGASFTRTNKLARALASLAQKRASSNSMDNDHVVKKSRLQEMANTANAITERAKERASRKKDLFSALERKEEIREGEERRLDEAGAKILDMMSTEEQEDVEEVELLGRTNRELDEEIEGLRRHADSAEEDIRMSEQYAPS